MGKKTKNLRYSKRKHLEILPQKKFFLTVHGTRLLKHSIELNTDNIFVYHHSQQLRLDIHVLKYYVELDKLQLSLIELNLKNKNENKTLYFK